jgi:prevent-host-death family protein
MLTNCLTSVRLRSPRDRVLHNVFKLNGGRVVTLLQNFRIICMLRSPEPPPMLTVSAAEFQRHFGRYQDEALVQPLAITRNGRERLVVLSTEEYRRLRRRSREVLRAGDLTDTELDAIARTEMDPRHQHLDRELE